MSFSKRSLMAVTNDKFEFPIAVASSFEEMDRMLRLDESSEVLVAKKVYCKNKYNFKLCFVKNLTDEEELELRGFANVG